MPPDKPPHEMPPGAMSSEASCSLSGEGAEETCALPAETSGPPAETSGPPASTAADRRTNRLAALIYTGISLAAAVAFIVVTSFVGSYPAVARYGGAAWIFILLMIVLMPIVIPRVKKRRARTSAAHH